MAARVGGTAGGGAGERRGAGMAARWGAQVRGTRGRRVSLGRRSAKAAAARRRIVRRSSRSAPSWVGQARRQTRQRPTGRRGAITGQEVTRVGRRKQHRLLPSGASRVTVPPIPSAQPSSTWRMDAVPGPLPLEELQLTRSPLAHRLHPREAELLDHALDRGLRDTEPVHAPESELCARGAVAEVEARMPDEVDQTLRNPAPSACRVAWDQPANAVRPPSHPPASNGPRSEPEAPTRRPYSVCRRVLEPHQPFLHSQPVPPRHGCIPHYRQPFPLWPSRASLPKARQGSLLERLLQRHPRRAPTARIAARRPRGDTTERGASESGLPRSG